MIIDEGPTVFGADDCLYLVEGNDIEKYAVEEDQWTTTTVTKLPDDMRRCDALALV